MLLFVKLFLFPREENSLGHKTSELPRSEKERRILAASRRSRKKKKKQIDKKRKKKSSSFCTSLCKFPARDSHLPPFG